MHQSAICQSELSLLEGSGHESHIDARPRGKENFPEIDDPVPTPEKVR